jgi:hypothetical protein
MKFHEIPSTASRIVPCGRTHMTNITVTFHNFVNVPINLIFMLKTLVSTVPNLVPYDLYTLPYKCCIGNNTCFILFTNYHTDIRMERLENSMNNCGVSGLFLTGCLPTDTFKAEYVTCRSRIGKCVQESSCGVILRYCCSIYLERREHHANSWVTTAHLLGGGGVHRAWYPPNGVQDSKFVTCDNRCV